MKKLFAILFFIIPVWIQAQSLQDIQDTINAIFPTGNGLTLKSNSYKPVKYDDNNYILNSIRQYIADSVVKTPQDTKIWYADYLNGSDVTGNGTILNPYQTAQAAVDSASANDVIILLETTVGQDLSINKSGLKIYGYSATGYAQSVTLDTVEIVSGSGTSLINLFSSTLIANGNSLYLKDYQTLNLVDPGTLTASGSYISGDDTLKSATSIDLYNTMVESTWRMPAGGLAVISLYNGSYLEEIIGTGALITTLDIFDGWVSKATDINSAGIYKGFIQTETGTINRNRYNSGWANDIGFFYGGMSSNNIQDAIVEAWTSTAGFTANRAIETDGSGNLQSSAVTATELNYLDGVTSSIQNQFAGKAALSHTHSASAITSGTLQISQGGTGTTSWTLNSAMYVNGSGQLVSGLATSTELGYLNGVTSNIQDQLNSLNFDFSDSLQNGNGTTANGNSLGLGGTLNQVTTTILGPTNNFEFDLGGSMDIVADGGGSFVTQTGPLNLTSLNKINLTQTSIGGIEITTQSSGEFYADKYWDNWGTLDTSNRFQPDVGFVLKAITDSIAPLSGGHDPVTLAGSYDYITLANQVITRNQIDMSTDVTGTLDEANIDADISRDAERGQAISDSLAEYTVYVSDSVYDATYWDGNQDVPTKNAIRDKLETMSGSSNIDTAATVSLIDSLAVHEFDNYTSGVIVYVDETKTYNGIGTINDPYNDLDAAITALNALGPGATCTVYLASGDTYTSAVDPSGSNQWTFASYGGAGAITSLSSAITFSTSATLNFIGITFTQLDLSASSAVINFYDCNVDDLTTSGTIGSCVFNLYNTTFDWDVNYTGIDMRLYNGSVLTTTSNSAGLGSLYIKSGGTFDQNHNCSISVYMRIEPGGLFLKGTSVLSVGTLALWGGFCDVDLENDANTSYSGLAYGVEPLSVVGAMLDDTAGDGDADKIWSANKMYDEVRATTETPNPADLDFDRNYVMSSTYTQTGSVTFNSNGPYILGNSYSFYFNGDNTNTVSMSTTSKTWRIIGPSGFTDGGTLDGLHSILVTCIEADATPQFEIVIVPVTDTAP